MVKSNRFFCVFIDMEEELIMSRIRDLREDRDLTQREMAEILNMSQTGYSKYETGENDIPTAILIRMADFFETSVDYLLGLTDEQKPYKRRQIK